MLDTLATMMHGQEFDILPCAYDTSESYVREDDCEFALFDMHMWKRNRGPLSASASKTIKS